MLKKSCAIIIAAVSMYLCAIPTFAASISRTIDNDSIASGYGNSNTGFSYITSSSLYNGDARYSSASTSTNQYEWTYPSISSSSATYFDITVGAYLAHSSFTDTSANYYAQYYFFTSIKVGSINQNIAPSGWSYITKYDVKSLSADGGFTSSSAYVKPSGNSGGTGADAISVKFSY